MEKITVILESKRYSAIGEYKDGEITIKAGSKLNPTFKENYAFSRKQKNIENLVNMWERILF